LQPLWSTAYGYRKQSETSSKISSEINVRDNKKQFIFALPKFGKKVQEGIPKKHTGECGDLSESLMRVIFFI